MTTTLGITDGVVSARRALEALRSGVPNQDAVMALGASQPAIESAFMEMLRSMEGGQRAGMMLVSADFGVGKSHLLGHLERLASEEGFVCSRVVISKETPLFDRGKVLRTALEHTRAKEGGNWIVLEAWRRLRSAESQARIEKLRVWLARSDCPVSPLFGATLEIALSSKEEHSELLESVIRFWAGEKIAIREVKAALRELGLTEKYPVTTVPVRQLNIERWVFLPRLFLAAGYSGWVLLLDKIELIERYSQQQRLRSEAEIARWTGRVPEYVIPGIGVVMTTTDTLAGALIDDRKDASVGIEKARSKGTEEWLQIAEAARIGLEILSSGGLKIERPSVGRLREVHDQLKGIHGRAYSWEPPDLEMGTDTSSPIRRHVRRWIQEWDLRRLDPDAPVDMVYEELTHEGREDRALEGGGGEGDDS